jgi:cytoskeletal protein CcmA (bactofilin family)
MAKTNKFGTLANAVTTIGPDTTMRGNVEGTGTFMVKGKIFGDVDVTGNLHVMDNAKIIGNISANNIYISGHVKGIVKSYETLKINSSATLLGDVHVKAFLTDSGSNFSGRCYLIKTKNELSYPQKNTTKVDDKVLPSNSIKKQKKTLQKINNRNLLKNKNTTDSTFNKNSAIMDKDIINKSKPKGETNQAVIEADKLNNKFTNSYSKNTVEKKIISKKLSTDNKIEDKNLKNIQDKNLYLDEPDTVKQKFSFKNLFKKNQAVDEEHHTVNKIIYSKNQVPDSKKDFSKKSSEDSVITQIFNKKEKNNELTDEEIKTVLENFDDET